MSLLKRHAENPILSPDTTHDWESFAVFNGSILKDDTTYHLLYRAMGQEILYKNKKLRLSTIGKAVSHNGISFDERTAFIKPDCDWDMYGCEDPRITKIDNMYFIFYTALSGYPPQSMHIKSAVALSKDLKTVTEKHLITPFNSKGMTMFPEKINGKYTVLLTANTDNPPSKIAYAQVERIETLWDEEFWKKWYERLDDHCIPLQRVSTDQVEIGAPPLKTKYGWLLLHSYIKNYFHEGRIFRIEAVLLDLKDPQKIIGRIKDPCLVPETTYEKEGQIKNVVFPSGALIENNNLKVYYGASDSFCCLAESPLNAFLEHVEINTPGIIQCKRFPNNPLLLPIPEHPWENIAVFNPAAVELDGKTYIIYRSTSADNVSYIGCAISYDGIYIDERILEPIYVPRTRSEIAVNKASGSGCEDPRVTLIDKILYMCYTAYDGKLPRLAMTSIGVLDFLKRNWDKWSDPKIISPPDIADKDGCIFPEKINGKYAFFHRIEPNIVIDVVDDLEFRKKPYLENNMIISPRPKTWDDIKIGINAPPLKTEYGWLVFYHGISQIDHHYRLGAFLLDLHDISRVKARTSYPILEPLEYYEKEGIVNNVVFPCGFIVKNEEIFLYYGGADKVVAGAKIRMQSLVDYLVASMTDKYLSVEHT
ncbi:MAG: hypothetical protein WC489_02190 [Patescibacteria group bacterium]